jgi:dGTPase
VEDVRRADGRLIRFSDGLREMVNQLEEFLQENVYRHYKIARMTAKAKRFLERIFDAYAADPAQLPPKYRRRAEAGEEEKYRTVCDYVAGMTDRYAQDEYRRLFEPFERV